MKRSAPLNVLLVEDDPADIYVIQRTVADFEPDLRLWVIPDGVEALLFLNQAPPFAQAPTPALILLDLKLPQMDGALLLPKIRQLPSYQATPIVIFSSAPKEREARAASTWARPPTSRSPRTLRASAPPSRRSCSIGSLNTHSRSIGIGRHGQKIAYAGVYFRKPQFVVLITGLCS